MEQINITNCKNCGAALHFDRKKRLAICDYCHSEYHLDDLGRIKEYMVELEIFGKRMQFYIDSIRVEPQCIESTRLCDSKCFVKTINNEIELTLRGYY